MKSFKKNRIGYLYCLPALIFIVGVAFYPVINAFFLSLYSLDLKFADSSQSFVGLKNYFTLLADKRMWISLLNTIRFTTISVLLEFLFGLALALIMHQSFRGRGMVRAISLVPWAIPTVISGLLWLWILNDQYGIFNAFLYKLGTINEYKPWLGKPQTAMLGMILSDVWKTTPFVAILLLAGLQMIPSELYEAAKIDGAGTIKQFWYITLPMLNSIIIVTLLFRTLDAFRIFDLVYVLTGGGPGNSTETISLYTYKVLFSYLDFGYGSSLAVLTFFCVAIISLGYVMLLRRAQSVR